MTYSTAVSADKVKVTINPYVSAWGSTLMQTATANNVERGTDVQITWDGHAAGSVIVYQHGTSGNVDCPVDFHTITAAEATAGRGTISPQTFGATTANLVGFAIPGVHNIAVYTSANKGTLVNSDPLVTADCTPGGGVTGVNRDFTVVESDTIIITGNTVAYGWW